LKQTQTTMSEKVNKAYLTNKVDGILDPMVTKILLSETVDHVSSLTCHRLFILTSTGLLT